MRARRRSGGQAFGGLLLILIGAALFAQANFGVSARRFWHYWPMIPLVLGLGKLAFGQSQGERAVGLVAAVFGGGQMARILGYWSPGTVDILAISLMAGGVTFLYRGLVGRGEPDVSEAKIDWISALCILSGFKRTSNSQRFRGGDVTALMGGCELDLRQASMTAPASIDVFVMWGGIEVRVPEDWTIELRGQPIMGGLVDSTRPPALPTEKRLIVQGVVLMGGVEVKN